MPSTCNGYEVSHGRIVQRLGVIQATDIEMRSVAPDPEEDTSRCARIGPTHLSWYF
jgi:hypothetical protein